jgi:hypothetical protein
MEVSTSAKIAKVKEHHARAAGVTKWASVEPSVPQSVMGASVSLTTKQRGTIMATHSGQGGTSRGF